MTLLFLGERGTVHYERALDLIGAEARAELEQAGALFRRVLELRAVDAVAAHQLGQILRHLGDTDEARRRFEQAIGFREQADQIVDAANTRLALALTLEEAGLLEEAADFADSAVEQLATVPNAPDPLVLDVERTAARLALRARAS